jgi:hypothetical protein
MPNSSFCVISSFPRCIFKFSFLILVGDFVGAHFPASWFRGFFHELENATFLMHNLPRTEIVVRSPRFEPGSSAWQAVVLDQTRLRPHVLD